MGLPLWKPKDLEEEEIDQEESIKQQQQQQQEEDAEDEDSWSIFPHQFLHDNVYTHINNTHIHRQSPNELTLRNSVNNHINHHNRHLSPVSSSIPIIANSSSLRRSRIARRHSMLTSSLMDRRRSSRVHHLPGTSSTSASSSSSPPVRSELDRRLQQRINEKEDLLEQLQVTVSLLDQFISARAALGSDLMALPSFITEDLPAVLESAASLAAMAPTVLSFPLTSQHNNNNNEVSTLHEMVDRLLQIPPYATRINNVESNIVSAHRRIREQLSLLGTSNIPSPIRMTGNPSPLLEGGNGRPSFLNFLDSSISRS